jgi:hypothetical protein
MFQPKTVVIRTLEYYSKRIFTLLLQCIIPSFKQTWITHPQLPKDDLCQVWLKLALRFWRRSQKCKSINRQTDNMWLCRKAHLSFQLRWAKNKHFPCHLYYWCSAIFRKKAWRTINEIVRRMIQIYLALIIPMQCVWNPSAKSAVTF